MTVCVPHGNEACYMCQYDLLADHREQEDQLRIAGRAMHDLLVWFFCHGWTDCDCVLEFAENPE